MITSPMSASFISGEPIVIVPTHSMPTSTPSNYYFGNSVRLGPQTLHSMSPFYDGHYSFHSSQNTPPQFAPLSAAHPTHMHHASNDMVVDESAPLSPSSSNSTDLEDEESAAAILHALESGSLSPRSSLHNPLHNASRGMKQHRRMAVSPVHARRKRVASLSEVQGESMAGKEGAEEFEDDFGMTGDMAPSSAPTSALSPTSWSLPNSSGLGFPGFSSYGSSVAMPRVAGASSTTPIAIPRPKPFSAFHHHASSASGPMSLGSTSPSASSHKKGNKRQSRMRMDNHQCPNCHTSDSPLWRNCLIKGKILHLCNSCGLRYKKHKYCPHCYKVYYDADTNVHDWAQCITCHNWTHRQCLSEANIDASIPGTYKCLRCLGLLPDCD